MGHAVLSPSEGLRTSSETLTCILPDDRHSCLLALQPFHYKKFTEFHSLKH